MRGFLILLATVLVAIGLSVAGLAAAGSKGSTEGAPPAARQVTLHALAAPASAPPARIGG